MRSKRKGVYFSLVLCLVNNEANSCLSRFSQSCFLWEGMVY